MDHDDKLIDLAVAFARIDGKLDVLLGYIADAKLINADHEIRLKSIEKKWNIATGVGLLAGTAITYLYSIIGIFHNK